MKKGLSFGAKILIVFLIITAAVPALYYVMNVVFWERLAVREDQRVLRETYEKIAALVAEPDTNTEDLQEAFRSARDERNMACAIQGDGDWEFAIISKRMTSEFEQEFLLRRLQADFLNYGNEPVEIVEKNSDYTMQFVNSDRGQRYLECFGYMADAEGLQKKFILSISLERMDNLSGASNRYSIVISIVLIIIGAAAVIILSRRMTKPVRQLSEISKRMTDLDFSAKYEGSSRDEIGVLGENMNAMSEKLEATIGELREANARLQKDIEEKTKVDDMRKEFIANVSHELKTPIAVIQGYAEGLKEFRDDPAAMDEYCDVITDEADKMNRMVKKLLTLNQLEFGAADFTESEFDMAEMIRGLVQGTKKQAEERNASVRTAIPETLIVRGDEFKIEEVLSNYYSNALNHLKEPNVITIGASAAGGLARMTVENTGDPIPEEELENIWIKFYKVDKARTRTYGGSGIGLSIVKAIMDAHHMKYGAENTATGVRFYFELPVAKGE